MKPIPSAVAVAVLTLGLAAPFLAGAEDVSEGQAAFVAQRCNLCHAVEAAGIEAKVRSEKLRGPGLPNGSRERALLEGYLRGEAEIDGSRHRKPFKGSEAELAAILDWLGELAPPAS